jgi:hypothetical protein
VQDHTASAGSPDAGIPGGMSGRLPASSELSVETSR